MLSQIIGWASSALLVCTISAQLWRQWSEQSIQGVSPLLFVGQMSASSGLLLYSILGRQWVFVVLNITMIVAALCGLIMWWRLRARDRGRRSSPDRAVRSCTVRHRGPRARARKRASRCRLGEARPLQSR